MRASLGAAAPTKDPGTGTVLWTPNGLRCPRCGATMCLRGGRNGAFFGCNLFPTCKGTRPAPKPAHR